MILFFIQNKTPPIGGVFHTKTSGGVDEAVNLKLFLFLRQTLQNYLQV